MIVTNLINVKENLEGFIKLVASKFIRLDGLGI